MTRRPEPKSSRTLVYTGPHRDVVEVPDGDRGVFFPWGEPVEVDAVLADRLVAERPDWFQEPAEGESKQES